MSIWKRIRFFQCAATAVFFVFIGILIFVCSLGFSRKSGKTSLSMIETQKIRIDASRRR
ncbi:MAG: hypothetical protein WD595_00225 [Waddliaceae bacterium]